MGCAKHMLEEEYEKRRRRNEMASCRRWGIPYEEPEEKEPKREIRTLETSSKNTLYYIRTYVNDRQYLYRNVYFDQEKRHFYYYYIKNNVRKYDIIPYEDVTDIHYESKVKGERDDSLTVDYKKLKQIDLHTFMCGDLYNGRKDSKNPGVSLRKSHFAVPDNLIPADA